MTEIDRKALLELRDYLFGEPELDEPDEPQHLVVSSEGANPPTTISDHARNLDWARRVFSDDYDRLEPPPPEENP